jgi:penicillin amidase
MWGQTQLMGDITDWYREELQLGADGLPATSRFQGEDKAITTLEETFEIADVALLGSKGRTEKHQRFVTFDGRWIASIEGRDASGPDEALAEGEGLVRTADGWIVPGDVDGDGVVTAISFDYTGLDPSAMLRSLDRFGHAANVDEFREATKGLVAYSQSLVAADGDGNVLFAPYQTVPCRTYLARNEDGTWQDGANPSQLLDGTVYGGFTIALTDDGKVDESDNANDPYRCVVPFDAYPMEKNHPQGYTVTANDDPAGLTFDSSLTNEPWYIGGPWLEGYRGDTIDWRVKDAIDAGEADVAKMAEIQADTTSRTGMDFAPFFIEAVERAQLLQTTDGPWTEADGRVVGLYEQRATELSAAATRLQAWLDDGAQTPAGVETFYHPTVTEQEKKDAVATMIFNAWLGRYISGVFDDEGLPGVWQPSGGTGRMRTLLRLLKGRGGDNPEQLASWLADTGESVFFDKRGTAPIETSFEIALMAMLDALAYLEGPPDAPDRGGFGTTDQSTWLWGLRHTVRFDSILLEFLDSAEQFAALADAFSITTTQLPLATPLPAGDPRKGLLGFPRPGDNYAVDAANSGLNGVSHHYGSGPVFRMVMALKDGAFEGVNILPGGQSALTDSDFFADQAAKWLGNETVPMRLTPEQVAAGATGRETFLPE